MTSSSSTEKARRRWSAPLAVAVVLAVLKFGMQLAAIRGYGWFRDEMYYVVCSQHLAWGFVDHPPLAMALLAIVRAALGPSLIAMRLVPALMGAFVVFGSGLLAVELGGGVVAVTLAGCAVLASPALAAFHHYYSMNSVDHAVWIAAMLIAIPLFRDPHRDTPTDHRLGRWVGLGVVLGIGLLNKWSVFWLAGGLAFAILATPARRWLLSPGPWLATVAMAGIAAPNFLWQAHHDWPTLEFASNAMKYKYVARSPLTFLKDATLHVHPVTAPLWLAGVVLPFTNEKAAKARPLVFVFLVTLGILLASPSAKAEYLLGAFPFVFAAGATSVESVFTARLSPRRRSIASALAAAVLLSAGAAVLPLGLPVLPVETFLRYQAALGLAPVTTEKKELAALPQFYADMFGWDALVDGAVRAMATIRPEEGSPVVYATTGGYGPAAAIDVLGSARGLPRAFSPHNSYWLWGPPVGMEDRPVILLGGKREEVEPAFQSLVQITTVECGYCMPYENHKPVYVGRGLKRPWAQLWPEEKHYE